jgi:dihydroxyacid dehydratase/phosphogluconate dehydratase
LRTLSRRLVTSGELSDALGQRDYLSLNSYAVDSILKGNLAPGGAVSKITGKEGLRFTGKCRAFDDEDSFVKAVESGSIKKGEKTVVVLRYLGPKGGPGEQFAIPAVARRRDDR